MLLAKGFLRDRRGKIPPRHHPYHHTHHIQKCMYLIKNTSQNHHTYYPRLVAFDDFLTQDFMPTIIGAWSQEKGKHSLSVSIIATAPGSFG